MKAVTCKKSGSSDPFLYCEVEKPVPGDREVLIRIHAVSTKKLPGQYIREVFLLPKINFGTILFGRGDRDRTCNRRFWRPLLYR